MIDVPPEFIGFKDCPSIPWDEISRRIKTKKQTEQKYFEAFTDAAIDIATRECMNDSPEEDILVFGLQACLTRGRLAEALFISTGSGIVRILSLRGIVLFILSDTDGLRDVLKKMEELITDESPPADRVRLSTVKVLLAAAEKDTSVIIAVMEFDNLLETHPEQVENPLTETMFTLYVIGDLLRMVGQASRATRINDTLQEMALKGNHRMFLALSENLRGNICNIMGEMQEAEKHYLKIKEISEALCFNLGLGIAYNNLGTIRHFGLNLEEAMEFYRKAYETMDMDAAKTAPLANLGEIAVTLGRFEEAERFLTEAIRIEEKTNFGTIEAYAWYVILLARTGREKEARKFLKITRDRTARTEKPLHNGAYLIAKASVDVAGKKWKTAIKNFEEALRIARDNNLFEILIRSELFLVQTHMKVYEHEAVEEELERAVYHLNDLIQIAKEQGLQHLYAESLLLRSDIFRMAGRKLEAKGDAERAKSIASYIEDDRLIEQAENRLSLISGRRVAPKAGIELSEKMHRVAAFRPTGQLKQVPRPDLYILLTLSRNSGLSEYVYKFDSDIDMDSGLISGFVSAITTFSSEVMGKIGMLRSINHEGFTLMMEHTKNRIITLIAEEESFDIRYLLREFASTFQEKYPEVILEGIGEDTFRWADEFVQELFSSGSDSSESLAL